MEQVRTYVDDRHRLYCYLCGSQPETREHVPPKVLLDKPYPENLPVVGACAACNEGFSLDEEYLVCLLEVAARGTSDPKLLTRPKVSRKLAENPGLRARLDDSMVDDGSFIRTETRRVERVLEKIALGLWSFECGETVLKRRTEVSYSPVALMSPAELDNFVRLPPPTLFPEVGSRMLTQLASAWNASAEGSDWQLVQPGSFSYAIVVRHDGSAVRMVVRDFLASEVRFMSDD